MDHIGRSSGVRFRWGRNPDDFENLICGLQMLGKFSSGSPCSNWLFSCLWDQSFVEFAAPLRTLSRGLSFHMKESTFAAKFLESFKGGPPTLGLCMDRQQGHHTLIVRISRCHYYKGFWIVEASKLFFSTNGEILIAGSDPVLLVAMQSLADLLQAVSEPEDILLISGRYKVRTVEVANDKIITVYVLNRDESEMAEITRIPTPKRFKKSDKSVHILETILPDSHRANFYNVEYLAKGKGSVTRKFCGRSISFKFWEGASCNDSALPLRIPFPFSKNVDISELYSRMLRGDRLNEQPKLHRYRSEFRTYVQDGWFKPVVRRLSRILSSSEDDDKRDINDNHENLIEEEDEDNTSPVFRIPNIGKSFPVHEFIFAAACVILVLAIGYIIGQYNCAIPIPSTAPPASASASNSTNYFWVVFNRILGLE